MVGAGGVWFVLKDAHAKVASAPTPEELAAQAESEAKAAEDNGSDFAERLYSLEPFVVNVTGDGYSRYLKLKLDFETDAPELKEELDARLPQIRDAVIVLLSSKRLGDITDFEGKSLLKEDIKLRVNDVLAGGKVKSIMFTEFVVQ